jgi:imidazolonepropionase-like amidohydrolase
MKKRLLILLFAFPVFCSAQNTLVIKNVSVIDMKDSIVKKNQVVIIDGNKIAFIGSNAKISPSSKIIDGKNKFLVPGLWDMHVHLWHERWEKSTPTTEGREVFLDMFIPNGITGVRDMGGDQNQIKKWKEEIREGKRIGPRIVAGPIVDGPAKLQEDYIVAGTAEEGKRVVDSLIEQKVDFVKVYTTLPREAYFAIAKESNTRHIPFEGHLPDAITVAEATQAGQKSIEHTVWMAFSCSTKEDSLRQQVIINRKLGASIDASGLLDRFKTVMNTFSPAKEQILHSVLKKNHTWICPTLKVLSVFLWTNNQSFFGDERLKYMPAWMQQRLNTGDLKAGIPEKDVSIRKQWYQFLVDRVRNMNNAGIPILAGTDFPFLSFAGYGLHEELELLVQAGLRPYEALKTATTNPAIFLHKEKELGTIEKGKIADLVLLDANPLENISNTKKIYAVIVNGKLLERKNLDELLDKAKQVAAK